MKPARAVGAGGALGARTPRGAGPLPDDGPVWRAQLTAGFAGRVVDDVDRPLAGALVVAVATCSLIGRAPAGALAGATQDATSGAGTSAHGPWFVARTRTDGSFTMPVLPHGRYTLFALHIGPPPAISELVVVDGGFLSVPLRLVIRGGGVLL